LELKEKNYVLNLSGPSSHSLVHWNLANFI